MGTLLVGSVQGIAPHCAFIERVHGHLAFRMGFYRETISNVTLTFLSVLYKLIMGCFCSPSPDLPLAE